MIKIKNDLTLDFKNNSNATEKEDYSVLVLTYRN